MFDSLIVDAVEPTARITVKVYPPKVRVNSNSFIIYLPTLTTARTPRVHNVHGASRNIQRVSNSRKPHLYI